MKLYPFPNSRTDRIHDNLSGHIKSLLFCIFNWINKYKRPKMFQWHLKQAFQNSWELREWYVYLFFLIMPFLKRNLPNKYFRMIWFTGYYHLWILLK